MKMKIIGVRVPEDSTIPKRLKDLSDKTRYAYYELIEQWLDRDDHEKLEKKSGEAETVTEDTTIAPRVAALESALATIQDILEKKVQEPQRPRQKREKNQDSPKELKADNKEKARKRTQELKKAGNSYQDIAKILDEEGIPASRDGGKWNKSSVWKLLN
jgi:hypothetical protein